MRVDKLSLQVKLELVDVNINILRTELDLPVAASLDERSRKKRVEYWINVLSNSLNHENLTVGDSGFDSLEHVLLSECNNYHFVTFFTLNPLNTLELGINHKWISLA